VSDAFVVGSGPNGLAAAAVLARAGVRVTVIEAADTIGGGTRSSELTLPGLIHDHCSAAHPMGAASPLFRDLDLHAHGLEWCRPEVDLAHPLDGGRAATMLRSVDRTAAGLGRDGRTWKRLFGAPAKGFDELNEDLTRPLVHVPSHPLRLARFGLTAGAPTALVARAFRDEPARALFAGAAAHAESTFSAPLSAAIGTALIACGHHVGWPVARGGSRAITAALASFVEAHGGRIETGRRVDRLAELPRADAVVLDLTPRGVLRLAGERLPVRVRRAYERFRHGPAAFKLDLAVEGGIPWANDACRRAGTLHLGGTYDELAATQADVNAGRMPQRPFVLVGQQYLADPSRSSGNVHPIWSYAHVPNGYDGDATEAVIGQIERFAPGVRERIVGQHAMRPAGFADYNANFVGGDILGGANTPRQLIGRPRLTLNPYATGIPGVFICSSSTPPGAGVHGMCGFGAAQTALRTLG
jgi:phytoene dehydrogenase-like protein